jgi:hypothetical protein
MFKILNLENKILKHYNMRNNICHVLQNTIQLTKTEKTVLSIGLKFMPQTQTNSQTLHDTLMKSLHDYHRNIALKIYFYDDINFQNKNKLLPKIDNDSNPFFPIQIVVQ